MKIREIRIISVLRCLLGWAPELNFHPLEVVSRYRDPQLQVGENYQVYPLSAHRVDRDRSGWLDTDPLETQRGDDSGAIHTR